MQAKILISPERAEFIKLELENVKINPDNDTAGFVEVTFEIKSNLDLLKLFHAGINAGIRKV